MKELIIILFVIQSFGLYLYEELNPSETHGILINSSFDRAWLEAHGLPKDATVVRMSLTLIGKEGNITIYHLGEDFSEINVTWVNRSEQLNWISSSGVIAVSKKELAPMPSWTSREKDIKSPYLEITYEAF